jgi:hypothetical protein
MKYQLGDIVRVGPFEYEVIAVDKERMHYAIQLLHTRKVNILSLPESALMPVEV